LTEVAILARGFALEALGDREPRLAEAAELTGLLHDLGKYRGGFQDHLGGLPVPAGDRYHKEAGAAKAAELKLLPAAFASEGHHGGLSNRARLRDAIAGVAGSTVAKEVWAVATADCPALASTTATLPAGVVGLRFDLLTRILFSCLVDADWSDTAEHERICHGRPPDPVPPPLEPAGRLEVLRRAIAAKAEAARGPASGGTSLEVAGARDAVYRACLERAEGPVGLYSLTVPTGGGKTLSGLAFALAHAERHGLRRVNYVAPYLSILDQNARAIREALGLRADDPAVFEHHGLADPGGRRGGDDPEQTGLEDASRRAENWAAPIVLTTNVMFFEM
jgi:CRISPR-associated endonuclease/helicase Cas3